jgi:hypothetical protein
MLHSVFQGCFNKHAGSLFNLVGLCEGWGINLKLISKSESQQAITCLWYLMQAECSKMDVIHADIDNVIGFLFTIFDIHHLGEGAGGGWDGVVR